MLCLVTDSRRLLGPSAPDRDARACLIAQVRHAIEAGIDLVQVRERHWEAAQLADVVASLVDISRGSSTRILVNDRLDVAIACGAGGVHLRADSIAASRVRAIAPAGFLVGRSVHAADEAARVAPDLDYLIAGTVFRTVSKPHEHSLLGLEGLAAIVHAVRTPVLAIGGVTLDAIESIAVTGAAGVAAIGLFEGAPLWQVVAQVRRRFDSAARGYLT